MNAKMLALIIAAGSGITMALQGSLNAALSKIIGLLETTFVVHLTGLVLVMVLLFACSLGEGGLVHYNQAPWYTYLGGILGVLIVYGVAHSIPKAGVAPATVAIILGQVFTACLIDHFGLFGLTKMSFTWCRAVGTFVLAFGAWLILKK
jgi:transporter family-2 protein